MCGMASVGATECLLGPPKASACGGPCDSFQRVVTRPVLRRGPMAVCADLVTFEACDPATCVASTCGAAAADGRALAASPCSAPCGGGFQQQVVEYPTPGCVPTIAIIPCGMESCNTNDPSVPVGTEDTACVTAWSAWTPCDDPCAVNARRYRYLSITRRALGGGAPCPSEPSAFVESTVCADTGPQSAGCIASRPPPSPATGGAKSPPPPTAPSPSMAGPAEGKGSSATKGKGGGDVGKNSSIILLLVLLGLLLLTCAIVAFAVIARRRRQKKDEQNAKVRRPC